MWVAVYWANNKDTADRIQHQLYAAGVLVKIRNMDNNIERGFEVLVEKSDVEKAHQVIIDNGF